VSSIESHINTKTFTNLYAFGFPLKGQAYDLKFVSQEMVYKRVLRTGDGSHIAALLDANNNSAIPTSELVAHLDHEKEEHAIWGWDDKDISEEDRKSANVVNKESECKLD